MPPTGLVLTPGIKANLATFTTLLALQRHTEWVSQSPARAEQLLEDDGYTLLGGVINPKGSGGQAYVALRDQDLVLAFRGSEGGNELATLRNVLQDLDNMRVVPRLLLDDSRAALVHRGFYESYLAFRDDVHGRLAAAPTARVFVTGFSLGSCLAVMAAMDIATNLKRPVTAHMIGTARTGNKAWKEAWEQAVPAGLRYTLEEDPQPRAYLHENNLRGFNHLSRLLNLDYQGDPIPLKLIDGRLRDIRREQESVHAHNRDKYHAALVAFIEKFKRNPLILGAPAEHNPLQQAADAEARSVERS